MGNRLPSVLFESANWIGEEGAEPLGLVILGGLAVMRISVSTFPPPFTIRNLRRIGTLQSRIGPPVADIFGISFVVGEGLLEFGEKAGRRVGRCAGSSEYRRLVVSSIASPMMASPSSLPQTSENKTETATR
jgi:hypothetical protein